MASNLEGAIQSLVMEINDLDKMGKSAQQGVQEAMGHKLIAVRELLREKFGVRTIGRPDVMGLRPPKEWRRWVTDNLTIGLSQTSKCICIAHDPEKESVRLRKLQHDQRYNPALTIRRVKRQWGPLFTEAHKSELATFIRERAQAEIGA